jgi:hypothetical protein
MDCEILAEGLASEDDEVDRSTARAPRKLQDPHAPSSAEVDQHWMTHLPYRSWCAVCTKAKGKSLPHSRQDPKDRAVPEIHVDYCFMGERETEMLTILVMKDRDSRMLGAAVVPRKGTTGRYAADEVIDFIRELGCTAVPVTLKSDQEPAIIALLDEVVRRRAAVQTFIEHSPVGESQSNGVVERGVLSIEGQVRILKLSLEARMQIPIPDSHPILMWLAKFAATQLNKCEVGKDGRTACERLRGKSGVILGIEFGEQVLFRRKHIGAKLAKLTSVWSEGVYVGRKASTGESFVATASGVIRTRTLQRRPAEQRWSPEMLKEIGGVPWRVRPDDPDEDGLMPDVFECKRAVEISPEECRAAAEDTVPRRMYLKQADFTKHGYSGGCLGCKMLVTNGPKQNHSEACRKRMETVIGDQDSRAAAAGARAAKFLKRAIDEQVLPEAVVQQPGGSSSQVGGSSSSLGPRAREDDEPQQQHKRQRWADVEDDDDNGMNDDDKGTNDDGNDMQDIDATEELFEVTTMYTADDDECQKLNEADGEPKGDEELDWSKVLDARCEEIEFLQRKGIYSKVPRSQCLAATGGKQPTTVRWVDVDKGEAGYRSRLVARDFKPKGERDRFDLFAATPPLEALRLIVSLAASQEDREGDRDKIMLIDVKKAHLYGKCDDPNAFIELPLEDPSEDNQDSVGKLNFWLYGMREAAQAWEEDYATKLKSIGFVRGVFAPTTFFCKELQVRAVVHGDDFVFLGPGPALQQVKCHMQKWYELKVRAMLGPEPSDDKQATILGRILRWGSTALTYEADPKHAELLIKGLGLEVDSAGVQMPCSVEHYALDGMESEALSREESSMYRQLAARANYLAQDRPDLQFAVKELCREMSSPTARSWKRLKRVARYLLQYPVLSYEFERQCGQPVVDVFVDSDHAGCRESRKSTTGFAMMHGRHCVKTGSSTQTTIAMSSGEAELYAVVRGASEGLGLQALADDLGIIKYIRIWTDSAAAKGMISRTGAGRQRHLEVKYLWVQQACREERFSVRKVAGERNPADLLTKPLSGEVVGRWLKGLTCHRVSRLVANSAMGPRGSVNHTPP